MTDRGGTAPLEPETETLRVGGVPEDDPLGPDWFRRRPLQQPSPLSQRASGFPPAPPPVSQPASPPRAPIRRERAPLAGVLADWLLVLLLFAGLGVVGLIGLYVAQKDGLTHWPHHTTGVNVAPTPTHHRTHRPHNH